MYVQPKCSLNSVKLLSIDNNKIKFKSGNKKCYFLVLTWHFLETYLVIKMYLGKHFHSCLFPWESTSITPIVAHENGALGYKKIYSPITISNSLDQVLVQTEKARICPFPRFETKLSSCSNIRVLQCQVDQYSLFWCLLPFSNLNTLHVTSR